MKELKDVPRDANGVRKLRVLKELTGHDNCWNQPQSVNVPAGSILACAETDSGHRGDLFFTMEGTKKSVGLRPPAFKTRHPYDLGVFNPEFLSEI
jgi:hypothetical protein